MTTSKKEDEVLSQLVDISSKLMPKLKYHNFEHAKYVAEQVQKIGIGEKCNKEELFLLKTAAYMHDIIVVPGKQDNEEKSVEFMKPYLKRLGYSEKQIEILSDIIMATKIGSSPSTKCEEIICDSDIWNIGGDEFWSTTELVRKEYQIPDLKKWFTQVGSFLSAQKFRTNTAKRLRNEGLERNKKLVLELVKKFEGNSLEDQESIFKQHLKENKINLSAA